MRQSRQSISERRKKLHSLPEFENRCSETDSLPECRDKARGSEELQVSAINVRKGSLYLINSLSWNIVENERACHGEEGQCAQGLQRTDRDYGERWRWLAEWTEPPGSHAGRPEQGAHQPNRQSNHQRGCRYLLFVHFLNIASLSRATVSGIIGWPERHVRFCSIYR